MTADPLKIAFVCSEYPPFAHGGIGAMTQVLARGLAGAGHEVRVIGLYAEKDALPDYEEDGPVRLWRIRVPGRRGSWILARWRLYRTVREWCKRKEVELVEAPDWEGSAAAWPPLGVPLLVRLHGSATYFAKEMGVPVDRLLRWLERLNFQRADFRCTVSRYTGQRSREAFRSRAPIDDVVYNGVVVPGPTPFESRAKGRVIFSGTLASKKGVVSLIRSWNAVRRAVPRARLHLLGKDDRGPEGGSMRAYLESQLGPEDWSSVVFHGHVAREQVLEAVTTANAAVFPSYSEAFALGPLEALACGCPTVLTNRASGPELIRHGEQGLLVSPENPAEISDALIRLLTDDDLAKRLSIAGREHVRQHFALDTLLARNEALYRRCISEFRSGRRNA